MLSLVLLMTMLRGLVLCYTDKRFIPNSVIRGTLEPQAEPRLANDYATGPGIMLY